MEEKEQNVFAKNVDDSVIHISDAVSGRNGYFCLGCGRMMIAKKGQVNIHHFSHDPKEVQKTGKCTYSDETYRHKLAKEVLQRIKQIKVPAVYKFPPRGITGNANKIKDSEIIFANKVGVELRFYESADGKIQYLDSNSNSRKEVDEQFLIIVPDITFFDSRDNPILFIEIVATHKVTNEKQSKIRKLGVDTIQVTIPKDSAVEIEKVFYKTEKTKWIYNNEEAKSAYIPISIRDGEGISPVDELQRELFEESYRCRASQIKNLIRTIGKCLGSESYEAIELKLREEIQRTERNTESNRERLRGIQTELQTEIDQQFEPKNSEIRAEENRIRRNFDLRREEVERKYGELEARYKRKKQEIIRDEESVRELQDGFKSLDKEEVDRIESHLEKLGIGRNSLDERIREIRAEEIELEREFGNQKYILESSENNIEREIRDIEKRRIGLPDEIRKEEESIRTEFSSKKEDLRRRIEFEGITTTSEIEKRNINGISKSTNRIKDVVDRRKLLTDFVQAISDSKRKRAAKQLFDEKSWKSWT